MERQKQLLGCGDNNCTAELSGALGARFVLQSSLTKLGDSLQLSLQMLDSTKAHTTKWKRDRSRFPLLSSSRS